MKLKIGIPRTLAYYSYYPLWKAFFDHLGVDVIVSPETNKQILDQGVKVTVSDACVPIKLMHGHVAILKDQVDYLFIPRLVSADGSSTFCPKFLGLPDMVKNSLEGLPPVIDTRFNLQRGIIDLFRFFFQVARPVTGNPFLILRAGLKALSSQATFRKQLQQYLSPVLELAFQGNPPRVNTGKNPLRIGVLGYPYLVYDPYISVNLLEKLAAMNVLPLTIERLNEKDLRRSGDQLPQDLFWFYSNRVVWSCLHFLKKDRVDGIIHITAFGCGPDAMVDKLLELECKQHRMPFITVTLDEQSGEAGVETRLEAFVDMLRHRLQKEVTVAGISRGNKEQNLVMSSSCSHQEAK